MGVNYWKNLKTIHWMSIPSKKKKDLSLKKESSFNGGDKRKESLQGKET